LTDHAAAGRPALAFVVLLVLRVPRPALVIDGDARSA
jgi:hypothetical protein